MLSLRNFQVCNVVFVLRVSEASALSVESIRRMETNVNSTKQEHIVTRQKRTESRQFCCIISELLAVKALLSVWFLWTRFGLGNVEGGDHYDGVGETRGGGSHFSRKVMWIVLNNECISSVSDGAIHFKPLCACQVLFMCFCSWLPFADLHFSPVGHTTRRPAVSLNQSQPTCISVAVSKQRNFCLTGYRENYLRRTLVMSTLQFEWLQEAVLGFDSWPGRCFSPSPPLCRNRLWHLPSFLFSAYLELLSWGVRNPEHESDHSPPSSADVKNGWSYTSTPSYVFLSQTQICLYFASSSVCILDVVPMVKQQLHAEF
jgi:hypothetical protein